MFAEILIQAKPQRHGSFMPLHHARARSLGPDLLKRKIDWG
jgi:hypothetical protein